MIKFKGFGDTLKGIRGCTRVEVESSLNKSNGWLREIERNYINLNSNDFIALANYYKIKPMILLKMCLENSDDKLCQLILENLND